MHHFGDKIPSVRFTTISPIERKKNFRRQIIWITACTSIEGLFSGNKTSYVDQFLFLLEKDARLTEQMPNQFFTRWVKPVDFFFIPKNRFLRTSIVLRTM